jgi:hypothetical protein
VRRIVSFVLLGLGVFAVTLGLLLRYYAYPALAKVPLDQQASVVATGKGVTSVVVRKGPDGVSVPQIHHDLDVTATTQVTGDLAQPEVQTGGDVAVWIETMAVVDGDGNLLNATEREVCIDRRTNMAIRPCEGQYIKTGDQRESGTRNEIQQPGLSFKFPFGTERTNYPWYDVNLRKSVDARFAGEDRMAGLDVYRFVIDIPFTKIGERTVPGSLIGSPAPSVLAEVYFRSERTMWVEPITGVIVHVQQEQRQELRQPGKASRTIVFDGKLVLDQESMASNASKAKEGMSRLGLLTTGTIVLWVVGGIAFVAGLVLLFFGPFRRKKEDDENQWPTDDDDVPHRQHMAGTLIE